MYFRNIKRICCFLVLMLSLAACTKAGVTKESSGQAETESMTSAESTETVVSEADKSIRIGVSFAYPSLDSHKEYYAWYTQIYGITETLFRIKEDLSTEPWLAESATQDGTVWTIILKDNIMFSNGNPIDSDTVIRNLERLSNENSRYEYLKDYTLTAVDGKTFTIDTKVSNPTLINELASPETAILDTEHITDFDNAIIGSGPFVIDEFIPYGNVSVKSNENYWNGEVKLDGATFIYLQDASAKQLAMQNGEIDMYSDLSVEAGEIFALDDAYVVNKVAGTRLQFMIFNHNRIAPNIREAINKSIDKDMIAGFLKGILTKTSSPFSEAAAYGKAKDKAPDIEGAKKLIEADGYVMGDSGFYEKDGQRLSLNLAYYTARSLDVTATLLYEQLKNVGIELTLSVYEDPDATYIKTSDFDLALYSMIADKAGDPYYFIKSTLKDGAYFDVGGFSDEKMEEMIEELAIEEDKAKRAELANAILQIAMDNDAFNYIGLFERSMVYRKGISGISENNPFDFYLLNQNTDIER